MKISDLNEARRNKDHPAQKVDRIPGKGQKEFRDLIEKYLDMDGIYLSFTELPKLGINPQPLATSTPNGIYAYPIDYMRNDIKAIGLMAFPLGAKRPWVNVFRVKKPLLNVKKYDNDQLKQDFEKLSKMFDANAILNAKGYAMSSSSHFNLHPYKILSSALRILSKNNTTPNVMTTWASLFYKLGYAGCVDSGEGLIHPSEPSQAVIFNSKDIELIERINLKTSDRHYDTYDHSQKNLPRSKDKKIKDLKNTKEPRSKKTIENVIDILTDLKSFGNLLQQETIEEFLLYFAKQTNTIHMGMIKYATPETILNFITTTDRDINWNKLKNLSMVVNNNLDIDQQDYAISKNPELGDVL